VNWTRPITVILLGLISGSCSGCSCTDQGGTDLDAAIPDAWVGSDYVFPDMEIPDTLRPDTAPPVCGGQRKITPTPVARGTGYACGKGCKQVTFGEDVSEYDVAGDLLVYSGGISLDREVYLVNLKTGQEWLIHKAIPTRPGCFTVATDGQKVAYTCSIWPNPYDKYYVQGLYLYDPLTLMEKDLQCWNLTAGKNSTSAYLGLGTQGAIVTMSFTSATAVDAFFYRFSDQSFTNISQRFHAVWHTHLSGNYAVYTQAMGLTGGENGYSQIMLYDTAQDSKGVLAPHNGNQYRARVDGQRVVWVGLERPRITITPPLQVGLCIAGVTRRAMPASSSRCTLTLQGCDRISSRPNVRSTLTLQGCDGLSSQPNVRFALIYPDIAGVR